MEEFYTTKPLGIKEELFVVSERASACVRACVLSVCADDGGSVDKQEEKRKRRKRREEPHAPKREEYKRLWRCDVAVV